MDTLPPPPDQAARRLTRRELRQVEGLQIHTEVLDKVRCWRFCSDLLVT